MAVTLTFDDRGMIPAIVQDAGDGRVLTLAYMDAEALRRTIEGPDVWFYSRSRQELWHKGETSGNFLKVRSVSLDCDGDAVVVKADPVGPACHTGETSCFHTDLDADAVAQAESVERIGPGELAQLFAVIEDRKANPSESSYTSELFRDGVDRIAQKVVEEAGESAIAGVRGNHERIASEVADMLYHTLVLMSATELPPDAVWTELRARRGPQ
ncbi:MAG: bifunctional phosphoribosyl-AMP cyclohydrolase/phosphoribosyl-ATP diphosphatase HisIE [Chloroflexi bacterium]|jgi:phosphoribosyl-AMP cyclohydrolase / phosphoribosyl-ATP pyrophosphohydrolase|nr:bifunctional phosphoribosyl-AMP cyclohydrolase/phosphoribosyl-ATP diphosphatase HisIE [Chloroflexota bacterium]MBT4074315.1 bifunctional phosphoribosyl-AMP cyclohydrolase/phosphoribosyl-ATP diphosphatase HisIE [Chloroflexota bacterium]MBT4514319.1 bifunctional phosphoribosyl-AMP cyclohydrolase/phosphoribosyl-ATP diphosphatase HisIE [Chloroflexota bacterium]MBT5318416.1 bifunctional phosphoribosyl-AMP cyclohydrolase/phosphoribosyl-ATP diphosphatase HisIE [Chloroflexota bacterium]MBT6682727.1 